MQWKREMGGGGRKKYSLRNGTGKKKKMMKKRGERIIKIPVSEHDWCKYPYTLSPLQDFQEGFRRPHWGTAFSEQDFLDADAV